MHFGSITHIAHPLQHCHLKTNIILINFRVEKYRPATLDDLISHEEIITTSNSFYSSALNLTI